MPWAELEHNYGSAADVPELLRGLSDLDRCEQALDELESAIYHQGGWVCSAATAAVPFLVVLAAEPTTGCRDGIIGLLGELAAVARTVEPRWVDAAWPGAWTAALPRLLALLDDRDPAVRGAVVDALSPVVDPAVDFAAALRVRFPRFLGGHEAWLNGAGRREQHRAHTTQVPCGAAGANGQSYPLARGAPTDTPNQQLIKFGSRGPHRSRPRRHHHPYLRPNSRSSTCLAVRPERPGLTSTKTRFGSFS